MQLTSGQKATRTKGPLVCKRAGEKMRLTKFFDAYYATIDMPPGTPQRLRACARLIAQLKADNQ